MIDLHFIFSLTPEKTQERSPEKMTQMSVSYIESLFSSYNNINNSNNKNNNNNTLTFYFTANKYSLYVSHIFI